MPPQESRTLQIVAEFIHCSSLQLRQATSDLRNLITDENLGDNTHLENSWQCQRFQSSYTDLNIHYVSLLFNSLSLEVTRSAT